jgi:AraC-like DNA-binding protein
VSFAADARPRDEARETARHWPHPALAGVDLLRARYVEHRFTRHVHDAYAIGVIEAGVERFRVDGARHEAPAGTVVFIDPDVPHDAEAGISGGWAYRMLYPKPAVVAGIAAEVTTLRGTPHFPEPVVADPAALRAFRAAHRAAEGGDRLAASSLTQAALGRLLREHAAPARPRSVPATGWLPVRRATELLAEQVADPPSLDELAAAVGSAPFPLLRAFRRHTGLAPHAWLVQLRVERAAALLGTGVAPAEVAARLGFADQAHLTRHFKRHIGVPPGAYAAERVRPAALRNIVQDGPREPT